MTIFDKFFQNTLKYFGQDIQGPGSVSKNVSQSLALASRLNQHLGHKSWSCVLRVLSSRTQMNQLLGVRGKSAPNVTVSVYPLPDANSKSDRPWCWFRCRCLGACLIPQIAYGTPWSKAQELSTDGNRIQPRCKALLFLAIICSKILTEIQFCRSPIVRFDSSVALLPLDQNQFQGLSTEGHGIQPRCKILLFRNFTEHCMCNLIAI